MIVIPFSLFAFVLVNRYPYPLRAISLQVYSGFTFLMPVLALLFFLVFRLPGLGGKLAAFTFTLVVFGLVLAGLWASGLSSYYEIGGLIPLLDGSSYGFENRGRSICDLRFKSYPQTNQECCPLHVWFVER